MSSYHFPWKPIVCVRGFKESDECVHKYIIFALRCTKWRSQLKDTIGREERDEPGERCTLCLCHCSCHPANIQHSVSSVIWQTACATYIYCRCFDNNASWGTLRDDYGACECFLHSKLYHMWLFVTGTLMQCFSLMLHCKYTHPSRLYYFILKQQMWWCHDFSYKEISFFISNLGWVGTLSSSFLWKK